MRLKTWLIVGGIALCLGLFVFGRETFSYLAGARQYTRDAVKNRIPTEIEVARLKSLLTGLDRAIDGRREALVDMQLQAEALEQEIAKRQQDLAADRAALEKAAALLEDRKETYMIGDYSYTYAEVDADARIKAERFQHDTDMLATRQDTLARSSATIIDTRAVLSNAEVERQKLADDIERLEIRAASLKTTGQIAADRQAGTGSSLGSAYEQIQTAVSELERRLTKGERLIDAKRTGSVGIEYAKRKNQQSGLAAIREALQ